LGRVWQMVYDKNVVHDPCPPTRVFLQAFNNILWRRIMLYYTMLREKKVLWRFVHPQNDHVTLRPKRSSPMDHHQAPPISGSWSPGAAGAVDGASLLHGPLRVDRNAETEKNWTGGRTVRGRNVKAPKKIRSIKRRWWEFGEAFMMMPWHWGEGGDCIRYMSGTVMKV
jgi:hypothetical protein